MNAGRRILWCVALLCALGVSAQAARVEGVRGNEITLSVGQRDGVAVGMTGKVKQKHDVGNREQVLDVAYFRVLRVADRTCVALLTSMGGFPIEAGNEAAFDAPLTPRAAPAVTPRSDGGGAEIVFWSSVKDSNDPADFEAYLRQWPNGAFASLAKNRLARLRAAAAPRATPRPTAVSTPTPTPEPVRRAGEGRVSARDGLEYVWIPPGEFQMGCVPGDGGCDSDESPRHTVRISRGFWMGRTEVTVKAYRASGRSVPSGQGGDDHPVVNVDWNDAKAYCEWSGGRLPTEAEWEYAARGGREGLAYPWGNELTHEQANYGTDSCCGGLASGRDRWEGTSPVGSFAANGYDLFDMVGNVWEWCADWYGGYASGSVSDPTGASSGQYRVLRGGAWDAYPRYLRVSNRNWVVPSFRYDSFGFRCSRDVSP